MTGLERLFDELVAWVDEHGYPSVAMAYRARKRELEASGDEAAETADTLAPPPGDGPAALPPSAPHDWPGHTAPVTDDEAWLRETLRDMPLVEPPPGLNERVLAAIDRAVEGDDPKKGGPS